MNNDRDINHLIDITLANIKSISDLSEAGIISAMLKAVEKEKDMSEQLMKDKLLGKGKKFDAFCSVLSPIFYDKVCENA